MADVEGGWVDLVEEENGEMWVEEDDGEMEVGVAVGEIEGIGEEMEEGVMVVGENVELGMVREMEGEMGENGVEGRVVENGEGPMRVVEAPGPTAELSGKRPVEVFKELLTPNIVTGILEQTNLYGQQ